MGTGMRTVAPGCTIDSVECDLCSRGDSEGVISSWRFRVEDHELEKSRSRRHCLFDDVDGDMSLVLDPDGICSDAFGTR